MKAYEGGVPLKAVPLEACLELSALVLGAHAQLAVPALQRGMHFFFLQVYPPGHHLCPDSLFAVAAAHACCCRRVLLVRRP
jgi:hypothetical protein